MAILSVSVSDDLKEQMELMDDVNWSAVARHAFEEKVNQMKILKEISNKSKLTSEDAQKIADKINQSMTKKFKEMK